MAKFIDGKLATGGLYIVVIRDRDMWLEGPFATTADLVARGEAIQAEGDDDPRWQSVFLPAGFTLDVRG